MVTKHTILSAKDGFLLEQALVKYGRIVSVDDLLKIFKRQYTGISAHKRIGFLVQAGWLLRVKRGLYVVVDNIASRSFSDVSLIRISNALREDSYVSFGSALNYYGMFDQYSRVVGAVTSGRSRKYKFAGHVFKFSRISQGMYFGFGKKTHEGKIVRIADVEKALIDYLYFDKTIFAANLVFGKMKDYRRDLDFDKFANYARRGDLTIQRKAGFMLDRLNIDTGEIYKNIRTRGGYSRFIGEAKEFDAKWRIYYDHRIIG